MDKPWETTQKDAGNGGIFSKINFGGTIRSPAASAKPPTSSHGGLTTILSNTSQTSVAAPSSASIKAPGLYRKVSSSFLKQPKSRIRTSSFGGTPIAEAAAPKYDSLETITSQRKRPPIPTVQDNAQEPRASVSELSPTTTIDSASAEPRRVEVDAEGAVPSAAEMEGWSQVVYRPDQKMFLNATAGDLKPRSGSNAGLINGGSMPLAQALANAPPSPSIEALTYSHIQEMASKRIATLDYLRKAHEGRVYWFQTLRFTKADLQKLPSFEQRRLARRATSFLLLGVSLPTILDLNSSNAIEFLRSLNALLAEFEAYQQNHPVDGTASSLSRARIPQMFKRAAASSTGKVRRTSSAADIGLPMGSSSDLSSLIGGAGGHTSSGIALSFPASSDSDLLPGEEYSLLLTPSLPFDPDFYETFATLCDVLIDCYQKLLELVKGPRECNGAVAELFQKADARVRKIVVGGISKEFEEQTRGGIKTEIAGIGKVVLGGLM